MTSGYWRGLWNATLLLGVGLLLGLPAPSAAETLAVLTHGSGAGADRAAEIVGQRLRAFFADLGSWALLPLGPQLGDDAEEGALQIRNKALALQQEGQAAYDNLELAKARSAFERALALYERIPAHLTSLEAVANSWLMLGATWLLLGNQTESSAAFVQAAIISPSLEPDARYFSPGMRKQFDAALASRPKAGAGPITLTSTPSFAHVYLNGQYMGLTPLTLNDLSAGKQFIRLEKDSYRPSGKVILAGAPQEALQIPLVPTQRFALYQKQLHQAAAGVAKNGKSTSELRKLCSLLGADAVLVTNVSLQGERLQLASHLYRSSTDKVSARGEALLLYKSSPEYLEREADVYANRFFGDGKLAASESSPNLEQSPLSVAAVPRFCLGGLPCSFIKWTVTGVGLGLGTSLMAGGGVLWAFAAQDAKQWRNTPQPYRESQQLKESGRTKALTGDVLFGVGAVATAVAIWGMVAWEPQPSLPVMLKQRQSSQSPWQLHASPLALNLSYQY